MDTKKARINTISKVWISLTTIPERYKKTYDTIRNMLSNMDGYHMIVLNIPKEYKRFKQTTLDRINLSLLGNIKDPRFHLNMVDQDYGPATKLIPTLDIIGQDAILVVCDDECYHLEAFSIAAQTQENNRSKSFTFWKYKYKHLEIPQGVDIITFWSNNLRGLKQYALDALRNKYCFFVDDMIIASFLDKNGIVVEQLDRKWKWPWIPNCGNAPGGSKGAQLFSLGGEYNRNNSNDKCYNYLHGYQ